MENNIKDILERFRKRFSHDADWDNQLYQYMPPGKYHKANKNVEVFLEKELSLLVEKTIDDTLSDMRTYREKYPDANYDDALGVIMGQRTKLIKFI